MHKPLTTSPPADWHDLIPQLLAIAFACLALALTSLSEAALVRTGVGRARQLAEERGRAGRRLLWLVEHRQEVLNTLILVINSAIIVASAYTTEVALRLSGGNPVWVSVSAVGMIIFILTFCELTPKTYGMRKAESVGLALAPFVRAAYLTMSPVARLLHLIGLSLSRRLITPLLGGNVVAGLPHYTDEEMIGLVEAGEEHGDIEEDEREMIAGVIEFADKVAREVMTPRTDMVWIAAQASLAEAVRVSAQTGYSRLPVCQENVDHVAGILYLKDVVAPLTSGATETPAIEVARPAPVVPESKKISEVLHLMQRQRLHMAIVIDEYGGTAGLVTIEDLLEEIFGEIRDEHDTETDPVIELGDNTALVDARLSTADFEDHYEMTLPEGEFDSIGGFVLDQLGHVPVIGEQVVWGEFEITVESVSANRIRRLQVLRRPPLSAAEEPAHDA